MHQKIATTNFALSNEPTIFGKDAATTNLHTRLRVGRRSKIRNETYILSPKTEDLFNWSITTENLVIGNLVHMRSTIA